MAVVGRPAPRVAVAALAVAALGVLAGGMAIALAGNDEPSGARPRITIGPVPQLEVVPPPCLHTDHSTRLTVAFTLADNGPEQEAVQSVAAAYLGPGMRLTAVSFHGGSCAAPGPAVPAPTVGSGESVVVVMEIALPVGPAAQCPTPYPVGVHVDALGPSGTLSLDTTVVADLSGLTFRQCPG